MRIVPYERLAKPLTKGYRPWPDGSYPFEVLNKLDDDTFIFFLAWGDDNFMTTDMEQARRMGRCIFNITGDGCYIPIGDDGNFYFTTHLNPMSPAKQMPVPYSYHQTLDWYRHGNRGTLGKRKYLASFQGSMSTNKKRARLLDIAADDIFVKEKDGWQAAQAGDWDCLKEHSDLLCNSYFTFCPAGIGVSSIRLVEAILRGSIPVMLDDQSTLFNQWMEFGIRRSLDGGLPQLVETLRGIVPDLNSSTGKDYRKRRLAMEHFANNFLLRDKNEGFDNPIGYTTIIKEEVEKHG